jgi:hypothetical protein
MLIAVLYYNTGMLSVTWRYTANSIIKVVLSKSKLSTARR